MIPVEYEIRRTPRFEQDFRSLDFPCIERHVRAVTWAHHRGQKPHPEVPTLHTQSGGTLYVYKTLRILNCPAAVILFELASNPRELILHGVRLETTRAYDN